MTIGEQILEKIATLLSATGLPAGWTVQRELVNPQEPSSLPSVCFYATEESAPDLGGDLWNPIAQRKMTVKFEVRAAGAIPNQAVDPMRSWLTKALRADLTLGGLTNNVVEGASSLDPQSLDQIYNLLTVTMDFHYQANASNQELQS